MITFTVFGTPAPAGSKRAFVIKPKNGGKPRAIVTDDSKQSRPWKSSVEAAAASAMAGQEMLRGPLELTLRFYVRRPQGHFSTGRNARQLRASAPLFPAVKPDVLKLARGVEDALSGIVYNDDAQITREHLEKEYGTPERVEIFVRELVAQDAPEPATEQTSLLPRPESELPV